MSFFMLVQRVISELAIDNPATVDILLVPFIKYLHQCVDAITEKGGDARQHRRHPPWRKITQQRRTSMEPLYNPEDGLSRPGYYAILPSEVRYDDRIPANAKLLYGEISALVGKEGFCYAGNPYFARLYGMTERSVTRLIILLEKAGYIRREVEKDAAGQVVRRKLYLNLSTHDGQGGDSFVTTPGQDCQEGGDKNVGENNTRITGIEKENKKEKAGSRHMSLTTEQIRKLCVDWIATIAPDYWTNRDKNILYLALAGFYEPRENKRSEPARTEAAFKALSNRLLRYSGGSPDVMVDMLERATTAGWKSVFPLGGDRALPEQSSGGEAEEWL